MPPRKKGCVPVVRLSFAREPGTLTLPPVDCAHRAAELARHLLAGRDRETFIVLHLDSKRAFLSAEVAAIGTLNQTLVHPREVFKGALLANAASIIVAHNHPSGNTEPSPEDLCLTRLLREAGELLGVQVDDHLIVGDTTRSLRESTTLWAECSPRGRA